MNRLCDFGGVCLDMVEYGISGNAILGIRDSGKTYTATLLAEELFDRNIPFIAFDPSGVWRFLRFAGPGRRGRGLPVVVAGGVDGDLPLSPHSATAIVEAAMKNGISLVIDLYSMDLSKADWRRIVRDSIKLLLLKNKSYGMRHIFIEEAAEFAPQIVRDGDVYSQVERLCRIGGNAGVGYTLINQRSQEINKAVLELCGNLMLHRQRGKNALQNVEKWLDVGSVDTAKQIRESLSTLPTGECWVWLSNSTVPIRVKVPEKRSLHPDRRLLRGSESLGESARADVASFVKQLNATLPKIQEEAEANDPVKLRARIAQLERQIEKLEQAEPTVIAPGLDGILLDAGGCISEIERRLEDMGTDVSRLSSLINGIDLTQFTAKAEAPLRHIPRPRRDLSPQVAVSPQSNLPAGEERVLTACIQFPDGVTQETLAVMTGYKKTSRVTYLKRLRARGFITTEGSVSYVTEAGKRALPNVEALPTGRQLQDYWQSQLPAGEWRVLAVLINAYPQGYRTQELMLHCEYQKTSVVTYVKRLRARHLVVSEKQSGSYCASPNLF